MSTLESDFVQMESLVHAQEERIKNNLLEEIAELESKGTALKNRNSDLEHLILALLDKLNDAKLTPEDMQQNVKSF